MDISFEHINAFYLLGIIPVLSIIGLVFFKNKKRKFRKIGNEQIVRKMIPGYSPSRQILKFILLLFAITLIIFGAANPRISSSIEDVERRGTDMLLALDVSKSMLADDVVPARLELAKAYLRQLLEVSENDRIGLIVFAGRPYMQMPLSTDHSAAFMYLRYAGPDMVPAQGTVVSEVLSMASQAFLSTERTYKTLILVTDGEAHDPAATEYAGILAENGVMVITVGVGTPAGTEVIDPLTGMPKRDNAGNVVISQLNESLLQQIAETTQGKYIYLNDIDKAVEATREQLEKIEKTNLVDKNYMSYKNYFQWFIVAAVLVLLIELIFPERKFEK